MEHRNRTAATRCQVGGGGLGGLAVCVDDDAWAPAASYADDIADALFCV